MNKLSLYSSRLSVGDLKFEDSIVPVSIADVSDKNAQLLQYIFTPDANGLPSGDIGLFVGDKASPEVREFIRANLLLDNGASVSAFSLPQDVVNSMKQHVTDEDIAKYSRNYNESKEEYAARLKSYMYEQKFKNYLKRVNAEIDKETAKKPAD